MTSAEKIRRNFECLSIANPIESFGNALGHTVSLRGIISNIYHNPWIFFVNISYSWVTRRRQELTCTEMNTKY